MKLEAISNKFFLFAINITNNSMIIKAYLLNGKRVF